jgi:hypothetical protein
MPLPPNLTIVPKNDYFTHFSHDGKTFTHREFTQVWSVKVATRTLQIHVSGPFVRTVPSKNGPVAKNETNFFGKKHLITTKSTGADSSLFDDKIGKIVDTRFDNTKAAAINDKRNKELSAIAKIIGGSANPTNRNLAKTVFSSVGYGPGLDKAKVPSLTFIYCNMLTPDALKAAFAGPLAAAAPAAPDEVHGIIIDFGTACVVEIANDKATQKTYEKIEVDAYFEAVSATDIKVHVHHLVKGV